MFEIVLIHRVCLKMPNNAHRRYCFAALVVLITIKVSILFQNCAFVLSKCVPLPVFMHFCSRPATNLLSCWAVVWMIRIVLD
jgi:hypothetical protein